ncbi:hypothetical protein BSKO_07653 [Bryopsis sp. KO-2023]|nr:hypothetical protein BSKO_07653 [Bryopsis sp. KO-2023]
MAQRSLTTEEKPKLGDVVVAIDFGTCRTAYSWTSVGDEGENLVVEKLEGAGAYAISQIKTPTSVLLEADANEGGGYAVRAFGYNAEDTYAGEDEHKDWMLFKWFKMSLHKPFNDDPSIRSFDGRELPLSIILRKSLEYVQREAIQNLKSKAILQSGNPHDVFWVLTLPAIWSDFAKSVMRRAAFNAGMIQSEQSSRLLLALEPECAAIASKTRSTEEWELNSQFLMVDCGGGTLDVTSFKVLSVNPLKLQELIPPTGGPFGAKLVDDGFFNFIKAILGKQKFKEAREKHPGVLIHLLKQWEEKKMMFRFDSGAMEWTSVNLGDVLLNLEISASLPNIVEAWNAKHPGLPIRKQGTSNVRLSYALIKSFFAGPVNSIVQKTAEIIEKYSSILEPLDRIVMAGGFANCGLLQQAMREKFEDRTRVIVGLSPDTLIVEGAGIFGARPMELVVSRKSKYTFGVKALRRYDYRNLDHRRIDRADVVSCGGREMINQFSVHGRVGDDLAVDSKTPMLYYRPENENQSEAPVIVLITKSRDVFMANEPGVEELATITVPFDMTKHFEERAIGVQFSFGQTEIFCYIYDRASGKELGRAQPDFRIFNG